MMRLFSDMRWAVLVGSVFDGQRDSVLAYADGDTVFADQILQLLLRRLSQRAPASRSYIAIRGDDADEARIRIDRQIEGALLARDEHVFLAGDQTGAQYLLLFVVEREEVRSGKFAVIAQLEQAHHDR